MTVAVVHSWGQNSNEAPRNIVFRLQRSGGPRELERYRAALVKFVLSGRHRDDFSCAHIEVVDE